MEIKLLVVSFTLLLGAQGQMKCHQRGVLKNFEASKYLGKWFEIYSYEMLFTKGCTCIRATYSIQEDKTVQVKNCCQRFGIPYCIEGKAVVSFPDQKPLEAKLNVTFFGGESKSNYWIMDTDYQSYAIVYSCDEAGAVKGFWLLSRSATLSPDVSQKVEAMIDEHFDRKSERFVITAQTDCA